MIVQDIEMSDIHVDDNFNCRGPILPIDVVDMARDIDTIGLQFPVAVMKYSADKAKETGFHYKLVAGFRRQKAFVVLQRKTIPCIIKDEMDEKHSRILNLSENLMRKDLNMMQEANAIKHLRMCGMTQDDIAKELQKSRGWVQVRCNLLDLPEEIQKEAAVGFLNQYQIREIYMMPREEQFVAVKKIKEAKLRGETKSVKIPKKKSPFAKKRRERDEIFSMMAHIQDAIGNGFGTRCLAWCAGEISDFDLYHDIRKEAIEHGKDYTITQLSIGELQPT